MTRKLFLKAPAKINLTLDILGKRSDGFHDLDSLFLEIPLYDELEFLLSDDNHDSLIATGKFAAECPTDSTNLILRAVNLYRETLDHKLPYLSIKIKKNIPAQAGLGGGSSDAAFTLIACWRLMGSSLQFHFIEELAAKLGSDCPFFLKRGLAYASGRGEVLRPKPTLRTPAILLVTPTEVVSTKAAFECLNPKDFGAKSDQEKIVDWFAGSQVDFSRLHFQNTFQKGVSEQFPEVAETIEKLSSAGASKVLLSGSGSSCFGLFPSMDAIDGKNLEKAIYENLDQKPRLVQFFSSRSA